MPPSPHPTPLLQHRLAILSKISTILELHEREIRVYKSELNARTTLFPPGRGEQEASEQETLLWSDFMLMTQATCEELLRTLENVDREAVLISAVRFSGVEDAAGLVLRDARLERIVGMQKRFNELNRELRATVG